MTKNKELFQLCKKVYELTGWDVGFDILREDGAVFDDANDFFSVDGDSLVPLYDSDYLLYKLYNCDPAVERFNDEWLASAVRDSKGADYGENADTPLKALLKLVISLSEHGVEL